MSQGRPLAIVAGAILSITVLLVFWHASVPRAILIDAVAVVSVAGLVVLLRRSSNGPWLRWVAWASPGALLVAASAALPWMGWWLFGAVLALAIGAGPMGPGRARAILGPVAAGVVGGVVNLVLLGSTVTGEPLRVDPAEFRSADLRVHELLADVPLHDVWAIHLPGGGHGRSLEDVRAATRGAISRRPNPAVMVLMGLRLGLGQVFGWDDESDVDPGSSYVSRLTETDRQRSSERPGRHVGGSFWVLYSFEREELYEIRNRTVHAFMARALVPDRGGYTLYLAIYVKPDQRHTPAYMGLVDPFRRLFVYPDWMHRTQRAWNARWGTSMP
jgi:hypothetical protein